MFAVPAFSLPSAIRRGPLAISFAALPDVCRSRILFAASGLHFRQESGEQNVQTTRIGQVPQNEHLQNRRLKVFRMNTYRKMRWGVPISSVADNHPLRREHVQAVAASRGQQSRGSRSTNHILGGAFLRAACSCGELSWNEHLQKNGEGVPPTSDPFAIATDRAMINLP